MPVLSLTSSVAMRCVLAEFLAGVLVSGWVISLVGLVREAGLRPRLPNVSFRPLSFDGGSVL
jgi:hypothetical protein